MENQQAINVLGNQNAPNITQLAQTYPVATRYFGATHPSLPNYLELWAGSTFGVTDDHPPASHRLSGETLGSQLDAAEIAWAGYFESLAVGQDPTIDGGGRDSSNDALYVARHHPIVHFAGYERAKLKPYGDLLGDLDSTEPPEFALVVPNMADNMHDPVGSTAKDAVAVQAGDAWVQAFVEAVSATGWWRAGGTVLLMWDEAYDGSGNTVPGGIGTPPTNGGPVVLMILSAVLAGAAANTLGLGGDRNWDSPLTHAGLLGSIETSFGLAKLRGAANSTYGDLSPPVAGHRGGGRRVAAGLRAGPPDGAETGARDRGCSRPISRTGIAPPGLGRSAGRGSPRPDHGVVEHALQFRLESLSRFADLGPANPSLGRTGNLDRLADGHGHLDGVDHPAPLAHRPFRAANPHGNDRDPRPGGDEHRPVEQLPYQGAELTGALGEEDHRFASPQCVLAGSQGFAVRHAAMDGESPERAEHHADRLEPPHPVLRHEPHPPAGDAPGQQGVDVGTVHWRQDERAGTRHVFLAHGVNPPGNPAHHIDEQLDGSVPETEGDPDRPPPRREAGRYGDLRPSSLRRRGHQARVAASASATTDSTTWSTSFPVVSSWMASSATAIGDADRVESAWSRRAMSAATWS
jgi:Phosphoesterase family